MASDRVDDRNLGQYFQDKDGSLWKMISYCSQPQATFELIDQGPNTFYAIKDGPTQVQHVVGCLNHHEMGLRRMTVAET